MEPRGSGSIAMPTSKFEEFVFLFHLHLLHVNCYISENFKRARRMALNHWMVILFEMISGLYCTNMPMRMFRWELG